MYQLCERTQKGIRKPKKTQQLTKRYPQLPRRKPYQITMQVPLLSLLLVLLIRCPRLHQQTKLTQILSVRSHQVRVNVILDRTPNLRPTHTPQTIVNVPYQRSSRSIAHYFMRCYQPLQHQKHVLLLRKLQILQKKPHRVALWSSMLPAPHRVDRSEVRQGVRRVESRLEVVRVIQPHQVLVQLVFLQYLLGHNGQ